MSTPLVVIFFILFALMLFIRINRTRIIGWWGEKKVSMVLSFLGKQYKVFNDVLIKCGNTTSQIDHIVVSPYGIFVIETKNYKGLIFGGTNSNMWTQNIWGHRYQLPNPIQQNKGHINMLSRVLPLFCTNQYISIITFSHNANLKINVDDSHNVVHTIKINSTIHNYKDIILTDKQQKEYINVLQSFLSVSKKEKNAHIASVKQRNNKRELLVKTGVCPICGGTLIKRNGKYGTFYGCSNYPNYKFITKIV